MSTIELMSIILIMCEHGNNEYYIVLMSMTVIMSIYDIVIMSIILIMSMI